MGRQRPALGTPFGTDGPWLAAILDVLHDVHDLLDDRLLKADASGKPVPVEEPERQEKPAEAVPVQEPAPVVPPTAPAEEDDEPIQVTEPAPAPKPSLPPPPPRAGRGSGLDAWQAFADIAGVTYSQDAGRNDIIAACVAADIIDAE